jgi:hypothetical protein
MKLNNILYFLFTSTAWAEYSTKNSSLIILSKILPLGTLIVETKTRLFRRGGKPKALPVDLQ